MNFCLTEMTYLKYFIPLVIEGNRRGIKSNFYVGTNQKYTNPGKYKKEIIDISKQYEITIFDIKEACNAKGITFFIEGSGIDFFSKDIFKISITALTDYRVSYKTYVEKVNSVIFLSKSFADLCDHISLGGNKNKYFGLPKYDVVLNKDLCLQKYGLNLDERYALIMYPRHRDLSKFPLVDIITKLKELKYTPIIKSRGKHSCSDSLGCMYFEDASWFPHTTMELIECSDIIINSGSTTIKEVIMQKKPIINFDIKPHDDPLSFLYDYDFGFSDNNINMESFKEQVIKLLIISNDKESFNACIKDHFCEGSGTSFRILNYFFEEGVLYGY